METTESYYLLLDFVTITQPHPCSTTPSRYDYLLEQLSTASGSSPISANVTEGCLHPQDSQAESHFHEAVTEKFVQ
jgi:hypothetical protein